VGVGLIGGFFLHWSILAMLVAVRMPVRDSDLVRTKISKNATSVFSIKKSAPLQEDRFRQGVLLETSTRSIMAKPVMNINITPAR
jgi:hypothetical protein